MTALFTQTESTASAQLIFAGERFVSLPKVSEMVGRALSCDQPIEMEDVTLTSVLLQRDATSLVLTLAFEGNETVLNMDFRLSDGSTAAAQAELIKLCHRMASQLPITHVTWGPQATRIPRHQFVEALQDKFPNHAPADVDEIAPRRVTSYASRTHWDQQSDTVGRLYGQGPCVREGDKRFDAHIEAYQAYRDEKAAQGLRQAMLADEGSGPALSTALFSNLAVSLGTAASALPGLAHHKDATGRPSQARR